VAGRQIRVEETVLADVQRNRRLLGFAAEAPEGAMVTELTREAMQARLDAHRRLERARLYADWAQERDLQEDSGAALRAAVQGGIA